MSREKARIWTLAAMLLLFCVPVLARADCDPHWNPHCGGRHHRNNIFSSQSQWRARGDIHGRIVAVDYAQNVIVVAGRGGRRPIVILPTTSIFREGGDASISDLAPGMHVTVFVNEINGALVAQIIRIR